MKRKSEIALAGILVTVGLIIGLVISSGTGISNNGYSEVAEKTVSEPTEMSSKSLDILSAYSNAMVEVVSSVTPSVVNISTTRTITRRTLGPGSMFNDPFFRQFFGDEFSNRYNGDSKEQRAGLGSGVIVDEGGIILTNFHVIKEADSITVTLSDSREFKGEVIGSDPKTDIAVIKIDASDLPAIKWGDSDNLLVGETVIAIGSPYGLKQTVTQGIVSAKGRANVNIADYEDFIQTDAAINPGNSGGPLINIRGELIGINTAIFSTSGGYQGIGFSIPSNMVKVIKDSLIKYKKVVRGWLGVHIQKVTPELAEEFKLKSESGALISDVGQDSPAEKGGLQRGDIIIELDGREVKGPLELRNTVASILPETAVNITVIRKGKQVKLKVVIGELPGEQTVSEVQYDNILKNVSVQDLSDEIRQELRIPSRISGVVVTSADDKTHLKRADVIMEIKQNPVESVKDFNKVVSGIGSDEPVLLLIYRKGNIYYLTIKP